MRKALIAAMAFALPAPALAQWVTVSCNFETECYEAEACDASALNFSLSAGNALGTVVMRSAGETVVGAASGSDVSSLLWTAETEAAAHLLSWGADGTARYSVHLLMGPEVVTYHGQCEAQK